METVRELLDAVREFQEDHVMTEAEAKALDWAASRPVCKIAVRSLPSRSERVRKVPHE